MHGCIPPATQKPRTATQREAWAGKPPGGFGLALIFWFFCIKAKEQLEPKAVAVGQATNTGEKFHETGVRQIRISPKQYCSFIF
jgi:hypothetical protein